MNKEEESNKLGEGKKEEEKEEQREQSEREERARKKKKKLFLSNLTEILLKNILIKKSYKKISE